jgi:hypothetical protein
MARLDSGADEHLLTVSTAKSLNYETCRRRRGEATAVVFGNGTSAITDTVMELGPHEAHVLEDEDLHLDLISTNPFLSSGFILTMTKDGGSLRHPETGEVVKVYKEGPRWLVDLEDIRALRPGNCKKKLEYCLSDICQVNYTRSVCSALSQRQRVLDLHNRMGHAATEVKCTACGPDGAWTNSGLTQTQIRRVMRQEPCVVCWMAKKNKPPIEKASGDRKDVEPGEIISADIVGKINPPTRNGDCWFFLFADVATGYEHAYTAKTKDAFLIALQKTVAWYRAKGRNPRVLRTDAERVLTMGEVKNWLNKESIESEHSLPEAHYQNFVERYVQTTVKGVSAMLHGQRFLKAENWDLALLHHIDCRNQCPNFKCKSRSPAQVLTGKAANLSKKFLFSFGDLVLVRIPENHREWKFDLRNDIGINVGQPEAI